MSKKHFINSAIFLVFAQLSTSIYAQNIIFKCTNAEGNILYVNERQTQKDLKCERTNLAELDKRTTLNKPNPGTPLGSSTASAIVQANTISAEQRARDERRLLILKQEFSQEESLLKTVSGMLQNIEKTNDTAQIQKLKDMVNNHNKNLLALKKEIDSITIKPEINLNENLLATVNGPKPPASIADTKLPVSLPTSTPSTSVSSSTKTNDVIQNTSIKEQQNNSTQDRTSVANSNPNSNQTTKSTVTKPVEKVTSKAPTQDKTGKIAVPQFSSKREISPSDFLSGK